MTIGWMRAGLMVVMTLTFGMVGCNDDGRCGESVMAVCSDMAGCPMTWTAAHDIASWGLTENTCLEQADQIELDTCSNVLIARHKFVDSGYVYYFDPASGDLYRIDSWVLVHDPTPRCLAGDGPAPECDDPHPVFPCGYMP